jgi:putative endonuclease
MYYVYLIQSIHFPEINYVGYSVNFDQRLETHNSGGSVHTAKYRPWRMVVHLTFAEESTAREFEKYLKSQSGRAFVRKRFLGDSPT